MAEVEALKQARREANAAKRAAGETVSTNGDDTAPTAPIPVVPKGAAEQICAAEGKLETLLTEISDVTALVAAVTEATGLDVAAKRQAAVSAGVGQLTAMMDEIDIGEIEDDEARTAARTRRKAINKRCALASSGDVEVDGDLAAGAAALKKAVVEKRKTL